MPFNNTDEALAMEAQCNYALGASVFTHSAAEAERIAAHLRTGSVAVNDVIANTAHPGTPFGGRGVSGWGVTQGSDGLLELTIPQVVSHKGGRLRPHFDMSIDISAGRPKASHGELMRGLLESGHAPTLGGKLKGFRRVIPAFMAAVKNMGK
jgi:aldehyde dehydrogenase (NAD+)